MKQILFYILLLISAGKASAQTYTEILGRPTDTSITISAHFTIPTEVYWEIGLQSGSYDRSTNVFTIMDSIPIEVDFRNLTGDTKYFYRTRYRRAGTGVAFSYSTEHSFATQKAKGKTFSFVIEADPHLDANTDSAAYLVSLKHMLSKKPDFLIDLGDNFMVDKMPVINQAEITNRNLLFRRFFNELSHSVPLYLVLGNHEGEYSWVPRNTVTSMPVLSTNIRKTYYPNPFPNSFYSGNSTIENLVGLRENYYSWEWGDALFIVLDPYWSTTTKSVWGWTLGKVQYDWLKNVLSKSTAKYKFVFCHQIISGNGIEGRGGSESVPFYEMGGSNTDGTTGFANNRPGWDKPVHTLLKENNCSIFFHGHDHLFAKQDLDNIVYQEVPQPSARNITYITGTEPGYGYVNGLLLPNRGYMYVTVSSDSVKVDYIRTYLPSEESATRRNGDIGYSYTIKTVNNNPVIDNQEFVKVFPSPASSKLFLQYLTPVSKKKANLYNAAGQLVLSSAANEFDIRHLKNGIYFLEIETDLYKLSKKIFIAH